MAFSALEGSKIQLADNGQDTKQNLVQSPQSVDAKPHATDARIALLLGIGLLALAAIVYTKVR